MGEILTSLSLSSSAFHFKFSLNFTRWMSNTFATRKLRDIQGTTLNIYFKDSSQLMKPQEYFFPKFLKRQLKNFNKIQ